jgi:primosomal protein N' (replication factor Y)
VSRAVAVAVPVPFLDALTYRVPDPMAVPVVGARVRVPLGTRVVTGCVVAHLDVRSGGAETSDATLRDVAEVLDREPFLPPSVAELCAWVADYYLAGIGDAVAVAYPPGARTEASGHKTHRIASLTTHGQALCGVDGRTQAEFLALTTKQRAALDVLAPTSGLPVSALRDRGVTADVLGRLAARGLVVMRAETLERDPFGRSALASVRPDVDRVLTDEQASAVVQLVELSERREFRVALLHGVTGSGKTEIYLRLAEHVRTAGRQSLLLVPEIALTPSMAGLLRGAFGERVAIQHSGLSSGERRDQWQRIRAGEVDVVVGTRSAVFAPVSRLGLIIVDEEHDGSYKQEEAPRYHGRDVAVVRGSREQALVVLGSATPSLETYQNAVSGKYTLVTLARGVDRQHARRVCRGRSRSGPEPPARRGHRRQARRARAGGAAPQSTRLRHGRVLPHVRRSVSVPALQRVAHGALGAARLAGAVPLLRLLNDGAEDVPVVRGAVSRTERIRDRARRAGGA